VILRAAAVACAVALATGGLAADPPEHPKDLGLVERASTRLAQLDVTVTGNKGAIDGLTAADFELKLNDKPVPHLLVDDLCPGRATPGETPAPEGARVPPPRETAASYLLYFDMPHLTQSGRQGALSSARELLPKLLAGGQRAMIVINALQLKMVAPLTGDVSALDAALVHLVADRDAFDPYAASEDSRLADILQQMEHGTEVALGRARRYASEERWRQERDLQRLSMVLGRLADLDAPKAVLYFADTMRQNAGAHYLSYFAGPSLQGRGGNALPEATSILADAASGALPLDRVVNEAAALGIRFYTVEGQGIRGDNSPIESESSVSNSGGGGGGTIAAWQAADAHNQRGYTEGAADRIGSNQGSSVANSQRLQDAQATLTSLAAETGGRAFLNGVTPARMAAQILGDLSCLYLVSFDPSGFPQDQPLAVSLKVSRSNVRASVRGRLVIQSDGARLTARVLSAFSASGSGPATRNGSVQIGLIPIAYEGGLFRARVQVAIAGTAVPSTTWDVGASLVSQGAVRQDSAGRIQLTSPNTPVVFEQDMDFAAGDYDLVAVAHELQTDTLLSTESHGSWPKLDAELASVAPLAVSQRRAGGFLRNRQTQTQGAVIVALDEPLRADVPTAVIALVCRAKDQKRPLDVTRTLIGERETPVGTTQLAMGTDRCAQVVDLIPPKMLGAGRYRFVITVSSDGTELAREERLLTVPEATPAPAKSAT